VSSSVSASIPFDPTRRVDGSLPPPSHPRCHGNGSNLMQILSEAMAAIGARVIRCLAVSEEKRDRIQRIHKMNFVGTILENNSAPVLMGQKKNLRNGKEEDDEKRRGEDGGRGPWDLNGVGVGWIYLI